MSENKKVHTDWRRSYRKMCSVPQGEVAFQLVVEESDLRVLALGNLSSSMVKTLGDLRSHIKTWIALYPEFRESLVPVSVPDVAPEIVRRMAAGAQMAGVGPFAAVAGTLAQMLAEAHVHESSNLIVENGGDIYMYSQTSRTVALLADPGGGTSIGLHFKAQDFPLALCASSATIGHSLSLGQGELAVVRAREGAVADAVATALGNRLQSGKDVDAVLALARQWAPQGVDGVFVQCGENIGVWGQMELTAV